MRRTHFVIVVALFVMAAAVGFTQGQAPGGDRLTTAVFEGLALRSIGPTLTTGRVADFDVDPKNPSVYWVATAAGGLWKSTNKGIDFTPVFDRGGSFNLCCVKVDPKNSNVIWLGTGENSNPRSSMIGDGVYKSTDGGATWNRVGLPNSEHLGNIIIDPRDSERRLRRVAGAAVVIGRRSRPLQDDRRRQDVDRARLLKDSQDTGANEVI